MKMDIITNMLEKIINSSKKLDLDKVQKKKKSLVLNNTISYWFNESVIKGLK